MSTKSPITPRYGSAFSLTSPNSHPPQPHHYTKDSFSKDSSFLNTNNSCSIKNSLSDYSTADYSSFSIKSDFSKPKALFKSPKKPQSVIDSTPSILQLNVVTNDWSNKTNIHSSLQMSPKKKKAVTDRFIPKVVGVTKLDERPEPRDTSEPRNPLGSSSDTIKKPSNSSRETVRSTHDRDIADACGISLSHRILEFQPAPPSRTHDLRSVYNRPVKPAVAAVNRRKVPTCPERVLDAPGILDDYYLNLLDWSCGNQVAVALEKAVYVWNAETGSVGELLESRDYIASVKWSCDGAYLSVGLGSGEVQIWDVEEQTKLRSMFGQTSRVGVTSWDRHILSSGSRSGHIFNHDVRIAQHKVSEMNHHQGEVCGLDWRSDSSQLASGGNDNTVCIWDARSTVPKFTKTNHKAAVKAVAWCPWQMNLLATGGGTYDKYIHFWNSTTGARVNSIDTGSQVTSIKWSQHYKELVSTHGFPNNNLSIWSYPSCTKIVDVVAHDSRVLHATLSPDGQTLATCASDENLKFWKIFESAKKSAGKEGVIQSKEISTVGIR
ncbi:WD repeat-containing protein [Yarrowia sp. C11]|nr:WD repeat-containing protein [Yarrowia sp. E02]KAG5373145.1 WD repeat-containing protein [Yarrowia sp. C11]